MNNPRTKSQLHASARAVQTRKALEGKIRTLEAEAEQREQMNNGLAVEIIAVAARNRDLKELMEQQRREDFAAGWEAVSEFAGDQGWRDPLVDPDMARDRALAKWLKRCQTRSAEMSDETETEEVTDCPNCGARAWNDVPNGYQCDKCGYMDT